MSGIYLIAETPRTDEWDHRYIIPPDFSLPEARIRDIISQAREISEGKDYLAIVRKVIQTRSGREGKEILVLCGVDVAKLNQKQKQHLSSRLAHYSHQLDDLVKSKINWSEAKGIVVVRQEFRDWQDEFQNLPLYVAKNTQVMPRAALAKTHNKLKKLYAVVTFIMMATVISVVGADFRSCSTVSVTENVTPPGSNSVSQSGRTPSTTYPNQTPTADNSLALINDNDSNLAEKFVQCLENGGLVLSLDERQYAIKKINTLIKPKENYKLKLKIESLLDNDESTTIDKTQNIARESFEAIIHRAPPDSPEINKKSCTSQNTPIDFFLENPNILKILPLPTDISTQSYNDRLKYLEKLRSLFQAFSEYTQEAEKMKKYCENEFLVMAKYLYFITCSVSEVKYTNDDKLKLPFIFQQDLDAVLKLRRFINNSYLNEPNRTISEAITTLKNEKENLEGDIDFLLRNNSEQTINFENLKEKFKLLLDSHTAIELQP